MYKIRLVLADRDGKYLDKLTEFINSSFLSRIKVSSYTKVDLLEEYLSSGEKTDVLLAHPDFLCRAPEGYGNIELVLALSDGSTNGRISGYKCIHKYQPGDKLVNRLINLYSEVNVNIAQLVTGNYDTQLVSVYSPCGGAGKTSVVLGLATRLSELGVSVLCLSLEGINSLVSTLSSTGNAAMTHIFLSLAEQADTLPAKVEAFKTTDSSRKIDFLEPPECFIELSELKNRDLRSLLQGLKQMGKYEFILVDLESAAGEQALTVFHHSDKVVLVQVPDSICRLKTEGFLSQVKRAGFAEKTGLFQKMIPVINKYHGGSIMCLSEYGLKTDFSIPVIPNLWSYDYDRHSFDSARAFSNSVTGLARVIIEKYTQELY
ncbi:MAG: P-loop NTPase family protein [Eubacteriales bacterium]